MEGHARDRRSAQERIDLLLDEDSFAERARSDGDGVITGVGTVDDRPVCVVSLDQRAAGDGLFPVSGGTIIEIIDLALTIGCPLIGLTDGGGARVADGIASLRLSGEVLRRQMRASGVIPQLLVITGGVPGGGQVLSPALADFVIMVDRTAQLSANSPEVINTVTGDEVSAEELAGGRVHSTRSGTAHLLAGDEEDGIALVRELLSYLPQNNLDDPPDDGTTSTLGPTEEDLALDSVIPDARDQPYDVQAVISRVLDDGELCEVHALFAPNVVVGFGRVDGRSVGVVANQPLHLAGHLDIDASEKAARFVRTCDAFNIPVITFVDVPGFLPGTDQEWHGLVRRSAKLVYAYAEATVPLLTVIIGKAYGDAYVAMGAKHLGVDASLAWPTAQIAVTSPSRAVNVLHRDELAAHDEPDRRRAELISSYRDEVASPSQAVRHGAVDAVIAPHRTRSEIIRWLRLLGSKRESLPPKKHGNIPL